MTILNLIGQKFHRLTAISYSGGYRWLCRCDCGRTTTVQSGKLRNGSTRSCGCIRIGNYQGRPKHGGWGSSEYWCWAGMIARCTNPHATGYIEYGGRGISVCDRWLEFANFRSDMGPRPEGYSIERNEVNGNYEPANCRWASDGEQARNTRRTRNYTINDETLCLKDWCKRFDMEYTTVISRIKRGIPLSAALTLAKEGLS